MRLKHIRSWISVTTGRWAGHRWHLLFLPQNMGWEWLEMPFVPCDLFCWFWQIFWQYLASVLSWDREMQCGQGLPSSYPGTDKNLDFLQAANEFYFILSCYFILFWFFSCSPSSHSWCILLHHLDPCFLQVWDSLATAWNDHKFPAYNNLFPSLFLVFFGVNPRF